MAFRFIAANDCPDHDTIATFQRRFPAEIEALSVHVLLLAREMGMLQLGTVALLDGTRIHANPSRHERAVLRACEQDRSTVEGRGCRADDAGGDRVADVVQAARDKQQVEPMLGKIDQLPEALGRPGTLLADSGYGIIKSVIVFRQFLLRGLANVKGEWSLVTMALNIKRMFVLARA